MIGLNESESCPNLIYAMNTNSIALLQNTHHHDNESSNIALTHQEHYNASQSSLHPWVFFMIRLSDWLDRFL